MTKEYLGIDPGASGGMAVIYSSGQLRANTPMPKTESGIFGWIKSFCDPADTQAIIEQINPAIGIKNRKGNKGAGKAQMSKLYGSYRALRMVLIACEIPFETVRTAEVWRAYCIEPKQVGEGDSKWKGRLKQKAQALFPNIRVTLKVSDALLFAEYLRRKCEGQLIAPMVTDQSDSGVSL